MNLDFVSTDVHLNPGLTLHEETATVSLYDVFSDIGGFVGLNIGLSIVQILLTVLSFCHSLMHPKVDMSIFLYPKNIFRSNYMILPDNL